MTGEKNDLPLRGGKPRVSSESNCAITPTLGSDELNRVVPIPSFLSFG